MPLPGSAKNLRDVLGYRQVDGAQVPITIMDRVEETIRQGAFLHDAAARVGVTVETLRRWITTGNASAADVLSGRRRLSQLNAHERRCVELAERVERAEAEAKVVLTGTAMKVARGGFKRMETTRKTTGQGPPEVTVREIEAAPDAHMLSWMLSHRWPEDFGRNRLEVTGPGGGPLAVDVTPVAERLREALAEVRANMNGSSNGHVPAGAGANGHGNGNGSTDT
jgi:hypothetical protein